MLNVLALYQRRAASLHIRLNYSAQKNIAAWFERFLIPRSPLLSLKPTEVFILCAMPLINLDIGSQVTGCRSLASLRELY